MNTVTFLGDTLHLEGTFPEVGKKAPDFTLLDTELKPKTLADFAGKVLILAAVPSLDTPVCDLEIRHFNEEATKLSDKARIVAVSCDLPFAQARWCGAAGIKNVQTLSDYMERNFGKNYGILIKELQLLARSVFVIDADGILTYRQIVPKVEEAPDYAPVLEAIKKAAKE